MKVEGVLPKIPEHLAIVMDSSGHRAGTESLWWVVEGCLKYGVKVLTLYAFSTESRQRPKEEVQGLMRILAEVIDREVSKLHEAGVQLRHIGRLEGSPESLIRKIKEATELTKGNERLILNIVLDYDGRAEIVDAVRRIVEDGVAPESLDEDPFSQYLYTAGLPDPDLIVLTAGRMRLSNFLIWQGAYAEYYSTPARWPDFDEEELYRALLAYSKRERRFGRLKAESYRC